MIRLTRLNGKPFVINAELIEMIDETPDTVITLVGGKKYIVKEKFDEVVDGVIQYRRLCRLAPKD